MTFIIDGTSGLTFNNATTQNSGGKVIQVVNATNSTSSTTTSTSLVTTGLTASITPLFNTSKILVIIGFKQGNTANGANYAIYRNASNITSTTGYTTNASAIYTYIQFSLLDAPATTSSTSYTLYQCSNGAGTVYFMNNNTSDFPASITLMEVAA